MRSLLRTLAGVLIVAGALLLADAALTLLWQEPVSALYAHVQQGRLDDQLAQLDAAPTSPRGAPRAAQPAAGRAPAGLRGARARPPRATRPRPRPHPDPVDRPQPRGRRGHRRRRACARAPGTTRRRRCRARTGRSPSPGIARPTARRSATSTRSARATITVEMPYGDFTYRVERTRIVVPTATWITQRVSYDRLVLSACHPLYSAAKRIVVFARLVRVDPDRLGAGLSPGADPMCDRRPRRRCPSRDALHCRYDRGRGLQQPAARREAVRPRQLTPPRRPGSVDGQGRIGDADAQADRATAPTASTRTRSPRRSSTASDRAARLGAGARSRSRPRRPPAR